MIGSTIDNRGGGGIGNAVLHYWEHAWHGANKFREITVHILLLWLLASFDQLSTQDSCGELAKRSREEICKFLQAVNEDRALEIFDKFCLSLLAVLEKALSNCLSTAGPCRSKSVQREKLWTAFHNVSVCELPKLWCGLFEEQDSVIPKLSPLVYQNVNQRLYEDLVRSHMCSPSTIACRPPTEVP